MSVYTTSDNNIYQRGLAYDIGSYKLLLGLSG